MGTTRQKSSCRNRLQNGPRSLLRMKVGTHSPLPTGSHTRAYTPKQGRFGWGAITTLGPFRTFTNIPGPGIRMANFAAFGCLGRVCSRRTQKACGTAMRLCVSLSQGVAAPPGCVIFFASVKIVTCMPCTQSFLRVRGGGITTLGVLCVLLKRRTAACQSGSFAVSLCPLFTFAKDPSGCCQYPH